MKYKAKQYALALAGLMLAGKDDDKIAKNFAAFLQKNGDMGKAKQILSLAQDLFIKKTGRRKVVLESARKIKPKQRDALQSMLHKGDIVEEKINQDLIAGVRIILNGEQQLDMTLANKLKNIF